MKKAVALASFVATLLAAPLVAEKLVRKISWSGLKADGRLSGGEVEPAGGGTRFESLRVTNPDGAPRTISLFTIDQPGVKAPRYVLSGQVSGERIEGRAYLEMWSFFAGGGRYFSRTLAEAGPMESLSGTFGFRPFNLPFTAEPGMTPEKLAVNVAFPGRGTVSLANLILVELDPDEYFFPTGAWLTPRQISLFGGIGGSVLGLLGALVGTLASRGQARALVLALLKGMFVFGAAALLAAAAGGWLAQPRELLTTLLLFGVICTVLPASLLGKVRREYEEKELRRMRALDAR
ncbi:MAG TPA: hypothetical protein VLJ18_06950 [Thermoanaerobaculia bacterium]|nr:hypothetical protein [Thermoanaerobaculia bacterium]